MGIKTEITWENSRIHGTREKNGTIVFRNIPYAKAGRWERAELMELPEGELDATENGNAPIQGTPDPFFAKLSGELLEFPKSEDCLNINIWVGNGDNRDKPVMFWVYGGAYIFGYNYRKGFTPEQFVKEHPELIVIAPNYRIGVLGSMNLSMLTQEEKYRFSNNLALLDIITALKWTKRYAGVFGGDASNVTLYGHSAGSNAISHLLVIPEAKGLFERAVCQSSFATDLGTVEYTTSREIGERFFELAGVCTIEEALRLSSEKILETQRKLFRYTYGGRASKLFSPVEDGVIVRKDLFGCYKEGKINAKQLMIGFSEGEYDQMFRDKNTLETRQAVIQKNQDKKLTDCDLDAYLKLHPERTDKENYMSIHNILGIILGGDLIARACSKYIPVYEYLFCLREGKDQHRALHGSPCYYTFGTLIPEDAPENLQKEMMDTWAAFMKTGDPNNQSIPKWPAYDQKQTVMMIERKWNAVEEYWNKDYTFWKNRFREVL